ncbi:hypothetical protein [Streptomyces sp. NPDC088794]|uniref:hypothetical protein n=1 Tax=Streptomyces sp. NPDC088794 TaxID=3365902 RepID=UPI003805F745
MPDRYHLTLTADGRPAMHGWWADETVARSKHGRWIGVYGRPGFHITLVDETTGETLTEWPEKA